jgi:hypothetical protein
MTKKQEWEQLDQKVNKMKQMMEEGGFEIILPARQPRPLRSYKPFEGERDDLIIIDHIDWPS